MPNDSDNPEMHAEIAKVISRRTMLQGCAVGAAMLTLGLPARPNRPQRRRPAQPLTAAGADVGRRLPSAGRAEHRRQGHACLPGFRYDVLIAWGDPVTRKTPAVRRQQADPRVGRQAVRLQQRLRGLVPLRHEGAARHQPRVHRRAADVPDGKYDSATIKKIAIASHGLSVVEIQKGAAPAPGRVDHRTAAAQPPDHRQHAVPGRRARRRRPAAEDDGRPFRQDRARHLRQLLRAVRRPGGRSCPAKRTSTATSTSPGRSTRIRRRRTPATASAARAVAGARSTPAST